MSGGKIQDQQQPIDLHKVMSINITLADRVDGPFRLEIQNIRLLRNSVAYKEQHAYESYILPERNFNRP